jgi:CRISPR/Cas system CMR subunit Cmr6 (Cas7 group RAMP superfamily)
MTAMPTAFPLPEFDRLADLAAEVHRTYFAKYPPLPVRWGQQITRKRRRTIRLGSYNHVTTEVRIHPLLNSPHIPGFFIQSIIYHEYLHHVLGAHHNRRFHAYERRFLYHRESQEWIRRNLFLLLGRRKEELQPRRGVVARPPAEPVQAALF